MLDIGLARNSGNEKKKDFKPHMMYHPKTGKGVKASTYEKHLKLKKKGYTHTKPKKKKRKSFTEAVESRINKGY